MSTGEVISNRWQDKEKLHPDGRGIDQPSLPPSRVMNKSRMQLVVIALYSLS